LALHTDRGARWGHRTFAISGRHLIEANAIHGFMHSSANILQRHHAEGSAPTAEPSRHTTESLTANPELENSQGQSSMKGFAPIKVCFQPNHDLRLLARLFSV
jgi:hypothetical protein